MNTLETSHPQLHQSQESLLKYSVMTHLLAVVILGLGTQMVMNEAHAQRKVVSSHEDISGVWVGDYSCDQLHHSVLLELAEGKRGQVQAIFHALYQDREYLSFKMSGDVQELRRGLRLSLEPGSWVEKPGRDFVSVALNGTIKGNNMRGRIQDPHCGELLVRHLSCDFSETKPCTKRDRGLFAKHLTRLGVLKQQRNRDRAQRRRARVLSRAEIEAQVRMDIEAKARAEAEAQRRATAEAKVRAEMQAESEAKIRAEAEAKVRAEIAAKARAKAGARARARARERARVLATTPVAIPTAEFTQLLAQLKEISFDPERLDVLRLVLQNAYFNSLQGKQVLETFSFDPKRVEAVQIMAGHIVDPKGQFLLLETFTFDIQRNKASQILAAHPTPQPVEQHRRRRVIAHNDHDDHAHPHDEPHDRPRHRRVQAMETQLFTALLKRVKSESFDKGRQAIITLSSRNAHFSSSQVKALLEEWTFDPAKVGALHTLAPRIIDLKSSFTILDVFTFDAQRQKASSILMAVMPK